MYQSTKNNQNGQALILIALFFAIISSLIVQGLVSTSTRGSELALTLLKSKKSFYTAESSLEDVFYRLKRNFSLSPQETLTLNDGSAVATIETSGFNEKGISVRSEMREAVRHMLGQVTVGEGASFNFGVQTGQGGFHMYQNSQIKGNVYSSGTIYGENNSIIRGTAVSTGPSGLVDGVYATSSIYAHTIQNARTDGDAYYVSLSNTTVDGTKYPNSPDQSPADMPISDEKITEWEATAEAGGVIEEPCPYIIDSDRSLGPIKINCDTVINKANLNLTGTVWIKGSLSTSNTIHISVDPSLGEKSAAIILDDPTNRLTGSVATLGNGVFFHGSGTKGSYVLLVSQNSSAENGGTVKAIDVSNSNSGDLLAYASHGLININNNAKLKETTAYKISLLNGAIVEYETGVMSILFNSGPSGSWAIRDWRETAE